MASQVKVGGVWLPTIGGVGELKWETDVDLGSDAASWSMSLPDTFTHPALTSGASVDIRNGSANIFAGVLTDPERSSDGWSFAAVGMRDELDGYLCLDSGGDTNSTPDTCIDQAIARGLNVTRPASLSSTPFAPADETDNLNYLGALLTAWGTSVSQRVIVDENRQVLAKTDPTTPTWHLTPGTVRLALTDEDYASDLYLRYLSGPTSFATIHVFDALASATRRREFAVDAFDLGVTNSTNVTNVGNGLLAKGKARYSWTSPANPSRFQITTPGGQPACLAFVKAGDMARAHNVISPQGVPVPYYDFVIGHTQYTDGADEISLTPVQFLGRSLGDQLTVD